MDANRRRARERWRPASAPAHRKDRLEAAEDEAPGVERRLPGRIHARVLVHLLFGGLEARLVGPDLPGEDDLLAVFPSDRAAEVSLLAVWNQLLPALHDP